MPRGVKAVPAKEVASVSIAQPMDAEELAAAEERVKDIASPLPAVPQPKSKQIIGGLQPLQLVGNINAPTVGHGGTLAKFRKIEVSKKGWVKLDKETMHKHQLKGNLVGYDPVSELALLNDNDLNVEGEE